MIRRLTAQEAKPFFWHDRHGDITESDWMDFRACDGVCGAFHAHLWPGVYMGHLGVRKDARGRADEAAGAILQAYALETGAERIIGWIDERNRAALAMCKRLGFQQDGVLAMRNPVIMLGYSCGR